MSNIRTIGDYKNDLSSTRNNSLYQSLDSPPSSSQNPPPLISFGFRNSDGSTQNISCLEAFFPGFKTKSFIFVISMIQIYAFLIDYGLSFLYQNRESAFNCLLYASGSKYTPSITTFHHVHRLAAPIILHAGWDHIFFNLLSQWIYGFRLEKAYGTGKMMIFYILAGIGGNLFSAVEFQFSQSVGASSSIFGIIALFVAYILENFSTMSPNNKPRAILSLVVLGVIVLGNLGMADNKDDGKNDNVDNYAHLGGFITGALMAIIFMVRRDIHTRFNVIRIIAIVLLVAFYIGFSVKLAMIEGLETLANGISTLCEVTLKL